MVPSISCAGIHIGPAYLRATRPRILRGRWHQLARIIQSGVSPVRSTRASRTVARNEMGHSCTVAVAAATAITASARYRRSRGLHRCTAPAGTCRRAGETGSAHRNGLTLVGTTARCARSALAQQDSTAIAATSGRAQRPRRAVGEAEDSYGQRQLAVIAPPDAINPASVCWCGSGRHGAGLGHCAAIHEQHRHRSGCRAANRQRLGVERAACVFADAAHKPYDSATGRGGQCHGSVGGCSRQRRQTTRTTRSNGHSTTTLRRQRRSISPRNRSSAIVVAVVDTGILPHPDLEGRVLAGYDFITGQVALATATRATRIRATRRLDERRRCGGPSTVSSGLFIASSCRQHQRHRRRGSTTGQKYFQLRAGAATTDEGISKMLWATGCKSPKSAQYHPARSSLASAVSGRAARRSGSDRRCAGDGCIRRRGRRQLVRGVEDFAPANCSGIITVAR